MCAFVVLGFVFPFQAKRLAWGTYPKWPIFCRVGHKTTTQSINICVLCCSSETSSYSSDCRDDEEIALAIQAAMMSRNEARSRFKNTADLIHRLFVCISGHSLLSLRGIFIIWDVIYSL